MALQTIWNILQHLPSLNQLNFGLLLMATIGYQNFGVSVAGSRHSQSRQKFDRSEDKPFFKPTQQNITVHPGDRAVLHCRIENLGTKAVSWRKDGVDTPLTIGLFTFAPDTRMHIDNNVRTREWNLIIQAVKPEDEGWYHCQVATKQDEIYYSIKLNVLSRPIYHQGPAVQVTGTQYVERGNPVQLICNATGKPDPPHDVEWWKDGEELMSDAAKGIIITKKIETKVLVSMLVIKRSELTDAADYICRSSNQDAGTITVHVLNVAASNTSKRDDPIHTGHINSPFLGGTSSGRSSADRLHWSRIACSFLSVIVTLVWLLDTRWQHVL